MGSSTFLIFFCPAIIFFFSAALIGHYITFAIYLYLTLLHGSFLMLFSQPLCDNGDTSFTINEEMLNMHPINGWTTYTVCTKHLLGVNQSNIHCCLYTSTWCSTDSILCCLSYHSFFLYLCRLEKITDCKDTACVSKEISTHPLHISPTSSCPPSPHHHTHLHLHAHIPKQLPNKI